MVVTDVVIPPELKINFDAVSIPLKDQVQKALLPKGARKKLKQHEQGPAITVEKSKSRCVKLIIATSAAGGVIGTVALIADYNVKVFSKYLVSLELNAIRD